jgi:hypothetical protein
MRGDDFRQKNDGIPISGVELRLILSVALRLIFSVASLRAAMREGLSRDGPSQVVRRLTGFVAP